MTCLEKLKQGHPDWDDEKIGEVIKRQCPWNYGYLARPVWCEGSNDLKCKTCWNLDIPEKKEYHAPYPNLSVDIGCTIKDSGNRTEFATGAVRDMREGKGRCDLMPLRVAGLILEGDAILDYIWQFQNTNDTKCLYLAIRHFAHAFDGLADMLLEVAKHFEEGAKKYGENNWQKGIPVHCYIDSAVRHYLKWFRGDNDEPHDRAFVWNLMCCIWEVDYHTKTESE